jgi:hypothetical protein
MDDILGGSDLVASTASFDFRWWLKADLQPPEFDFRFPPNNGHSEAHAGLPVLTQSV